MILLLLAAAVLVDLVVLSIVGSAAGSSFRWPHPLTAVLFSLAFSQVSMAAIWAGLGETSLPWRLAGLVGVVTLWSVALAMDTVAGWGRDHWGVLLLGHALPILSIFLVIRARGGRLADHTRMNTKPEESRWQFSLGHLFAWLTATGVSLGLLRYTIGFDSLIADRYWYVILVFCPCNAVVSLATFWAALGNKWLVWRVVVLCLAAGVVLPLPLVSGGTMAAFHPWVILWIPHVVWLLAWLSVLRMAGIRFVRRDRGR